MTRLPKKITNPEDDISSINTNFEGIFLDLIERSGDFSSIGEVEGLTVPAGETRVVVVSCIDTREKYAVDRLPIIPRIQIYVDGVANTDANLYPTGGDLTQTVIHNLQVSTNISRIVQVAATNEKATYWVYIRNSDSSSHELWIYVDSFFVPAPDGGISQRSQWWSGGSSS